MPITSNGSRSISTVRAQDAPGLPPKRRCHSAVAQHRHSRVGARLLLGEHAARHRRAAEQRQRAGGHRRRRHAFRFAAAAERPFARPRTPRAPPPAAAPLRKR